MLTLLLYVIILGIIAWGVRQIPMDQPFKTVAYVILLILLVIVLFRAIPLIAPEFR
jgi:hypothetical protein